MFAKERRNPCSRHPSVYQDLSTRHDWTVKKAIVNLPIRLKGNSKLLSGNSLSPLGRGPEQGYRRCLADFTKGDVTRDDSQRQFLAQHSVVMLEQCCNAALQ